MLEKNSEMLIRSKSFEGKETERQQVGCKVAVLGAEQGEISLGE